MGIIINNFLFSKFQKPRPTCPEPPRRDLSKTGLKFGGGLVLMTWQPSAQFEIISLEHCTTLEGTWPYLALLGRWSTSVLGPWLEGTCTVLGSSMICENCAMMSVRSGRPAKPRYEGRHPVAPRRHRARRCMPTASAASSELLRGST